ncbi:SLAP domain-containing protein [Companilactobacillus kimchiensis]|uniref:S-layer protein C-terminal domain-containing protein n=1 Tax=Companilactobacillus kimchiensis TaxID=993692 RepID=A0A0R2LHU4_9LACO|nr:SLAP domain-containing protein [Companilactobacillus kimchiensis]KRN98317.1 hypothetical protein IV57_GL001234 [Companilactobacillus kimchiensis]
MAESSGQDAGRWGGNSSTITTITVNNALPAPKNSSYLFSDMPKLTTINNLENLKLDNTTDIQGMFKNDSSITKIDFTNNTLHAIKDISHAFENDTNLESVVFPTGNAVNLSGVSNANSAFANDINLVNPGVSAWQVAQLTDSRSMFKNDAKIASLDLHGWLTSKNLNSGDSSIGEGMFDGTDLQSIRIHNQAYFSNSTALTSTSGSKWQNGNVTFMGIPTATSGLGFTFTKDVPVASAGYTASSDGNQKWDQYARLYTAVSSPDGTTVMNLVTVPTNHGNITVEAQGIIGQSNSVALKPTITINGQTYTTTTSSVMATFGQTMATADKDAKGNALNEANPVIYLGAAVSGTSTKTIKTSQGGDVTLTIPAGNVGGTSSVDIPQDQLPEGYHAVNPTLTVTYTDDATDPYSLDTPEIELVGNDVTPVANTFETPNNVTPTAGSIVSTDGSDSTIINAKVGDKVNLKLPTAEGYKAFDNNGKEITEVPGTLNPDGTFKPDNTDLDLTKVTYVGNAVDKLPVVSITDPDNKSTDGSFISSDGSPVSSVKVGDKVSLKVPDVTGYAPTDATGKKLVDADGKTLTEIPGSINADGKFVPDDNSLDVSKIDYVGNTVDKMPVVSITDPDNKSTDGSFISSDGSPVSSVKVGDKVSLKVPDVTGYAPTDATGKKLVDADGKTLTEIPGSINADGKFVPDDNSLDVSKIDYVGNTVDKMPVVSITDPDNKSTDGSFVSSDGSPVSSVNVGDKVSLKVPDVTGYTPTDATGKKLVDANGKALTEIPGSINADGKFVPDDNSLDVSKVDYAGNSVDKMPVVSITDPDNKSTDGSFVSSDGSPVSSVNVGDKVSLKVPDVTGYTPTDATGKKLVDATGKALTEIPGSINADGKFVPDDNSLDVSKVDYAGNSVDKMPVVSITDPDNKSTDGSFVSSDGSPVSSVNVGDKVSLKVPDVTGYTPTDATGKKLVDATGKALTEIPGSINADGKFVPDDNSLDVSKVDYVGDTINKPSTDALFNTPNGQTTGSLVTTDGNAIPDGTSKVGDKVILKLPVVGGYKVADEKGNILKGTDGNPLTEVTGTLGIDGKFIPDDRSFDPAKLTYIGDTVTTMPAVSFKDPKDKPVTGSIVSNDGQDTPLTSTKVGDHVVVKIPKIDGYHATGKDGKLIDKISGTINPEGKFVPDSTKVEDIAYVGDSVSNATATVKATQNGTTDLPDFTVSDLTGKVGDTVEVKVPTKAGYTADQTVVKGVIQPDGKTVKVTEPVNYTGSKYTDSVATIQTNNHGPQQVHISGQVGQSVTVNVPTIEGYTPDRKQVSGIMDENGDVKPTEVVNYTPNNITTGTATISTPNGDQTVTDLHGTVNDNGKVSITVPKVTGYTPDKETITGTMNPNGTVTPDETVTYTGNPVTGKAVIIPATKDNQNTPQTVTGLSGIVGQTLTISVPQISGYTANVTTVKAVINPDNTITTTDSVIYTKNPISHHSSSSSETPVVTTPDTNHEATAPVHQNVNVATFSDQPDVQLYEIDSSSNVTPIDNTTLKQNSGWFSDQKVTIDGTTYYRVSTNQWAKAGQVYTYNKTNLHIRTYDDSAKDIYKAESELVKSRLIAADSSWLTDRTIDLDDTGYYRVSTNEFVKAADAYVYEPINNVVRTHSNTPRISLYTAKGELLNDRSLAANTDWLADSITYINGVEYYRVSTNEFVKASDVDVNY